MRFKLLLSVDRQAYGNVLPLNYQYELSAVILKILSQASNEYATWLHDNGFILDKKQFKLFTFSRLLIPDYRINKSDSTLVINSNKVEWYLSFLPEQSTEKFIQGVFINRTFELGDYKNKVKFSIDNIELQPMPDFSIEYQYETLSPICLSKRQNDSHHAQYISPDDPEAGELIINGLINRYRAYYQKEYEGDRTYIYKVLNEPKPVLIKIKANTPEETKVRGFMCKFQMKADVELMKVMYRSGCAEKGSQGFGMVRMIK